MNEKNKKIIRLIIIITLLLFIGFGIFILYRHRTLGERLYCNEEICYDYKNGKLIKFVYQEDTNYDDEGVKKLEKIGPIDQKNITILNHDEYRLIIQDNSTKKVEHYYKEDYRYYVIDEQETVNIENEEKIIGKAYKKDKEEYYFISEHVVLYAKEKGKQKRMTYFIQSFEDEYHDIEFQWSDIDETLEDKEKFSYTYNDKTDELSEFTRIDELQLIDTSYYDKDGNIIDNDNYYTNGFYRYIENEEESELYLHKNILTMVSNSNVERSKLKIKNIDDEIIEYDYWIPLTLNRQTGEIITYKTPKRSLEKISQEDCKIMDTTVFQEDGAIKTNVNIDGAYILEEKDEYVEYYIQGNTIKYYNRYIKKTLTGTIKEIAKNKTTIYYEVDFKDKEKMVEKYEMTYDVINQKIHISYYDPKKTNEKNLKYIKP